MGERILINGLLKPHRKYIRDSATTGVMQRCEGTDMSPLPPYRSIDTRNMFRAEEKRRNGYR
jgi:hypothetical protein